MGIPKKHQTKIFKRFYRADNVVSENIKGTGLGLYMSKSLIEKMKGDIWFKSEKVEGTTFWITLPIWE